MQNRYVADIGDYGKYGLLRNILKSSLKLGINWYLVMDENHNNDGKHTTYLNKLRYEKCDIELYHILKTIMDNNNRCIESIEQSNIFPKETIFYSSVLQYPTDSTYNERLTIRSEWHANSKLKLNNCEIIFLDPDNGLEIQSTSLYSNGKNKKGNKYVGKEELKDYFSMGKSIILYNHRERKQETEYINKFKEYMNQYVFCNGKSFCMKFKRGTIRDYIFILQPNHHEMIRDICNEFLKTPWNEHFELITIKE